MASSAYPFTPERTRPNLSTTSEFISAADTNDASAYGQVSENVDLAGQSALEGHVNAAKPTPSIARSFKTTHQWESLNEEINNDIRDYQSSGVEPAEFIRLTFKQNEKEYEELERRASNLVKSLKEHTNFGGNLNEFKSAVENMDEAGMYEPLVNMGNMILEGAEPEEENKEDGHKVRLWYLKEKLLMGTKGEIKPDLVIIPKAVRDRVSALQAQEEERKKEKEKKNGKKKEVVGEEENGSLKDVEKVDDPKCEEEEHLVVQEKMPLAEDGREEKSHKQKEDLQSRVHVGEVLTVFECKARPNVKERNNAIAMSIASSAREGSTITSQKSTSSRISDTSANRKRAASPTPVSGMSSNKKPRILVYGSGQSAGKKKVKRSQRNRNRKSNDAPAPPQGALQLARYATEMLSARGDRKFTVGVRLNANQMSFSFYNRASIIESKAFDLCKDQNYFAMFLLMFQRHPTTYGLNPITGYRDPFDLKNIETMKMNIADLIDAKYSTFDQSMYSNLKLEDALSSEFCLIGRGSAVFKASDPTDNKAPTMAVKFSWQENTRRHEIENILDARRILKNKNVVEAYGYADLKDDSPGEALYNACSNKKRYKERRLRILVMKYYHTLAEIEDPDKFRRLVIQLVEGEYAFLYSQSNWYI